MTEVKVDSAEQVLDGVPEQWRHTTPTNPKKQLTPFSRRPVTGHYAEAYHKLAEKRPDGVMVTQTPSAVDPSLGTTTTYADWAEAVERFSDALYAAGVREWDPVVIAKSNHPDVQALGMAVARLGAVPIQLAWVYDAPTYRAILAKCERPWLVSDPSTLARMDSDLTGDSAELRGLIVVGDTEADELRDGAVRLAGLFGADTAPVSIRKWSEPMVATPTSGTTGVPKLVLHSAESIYAMTHLETETWFGYGLGSEDTVAICDPYFHHRMLTGIIALATSTPEVIVFLTDGEDLSAVGALLREHQPTFTETLPNTFLRWQKSLLPEYGDAFARTRIFLNSFDAIRTRTIREFLAASQHSGAVWVQSWSQSENGPVVVRPYLRWSVRKVGQLPPPTAELGWPIPTYSRLRCRDAETGEVLGADQPGVIDIAGPGRCIGYLGEQDRHDAKVDGQWWNTGDIGSLGRLGSVTFHGREVYGATDVSCIQLEDVLLDRLPELSDVVILAPREGGLVPVCALPSGEELTADRWQEAVEGLPELGEPIQVTWEDIPRTATWKVRRTVLLADLVGSTPLGSGRWT
ncbi:MAG: class I adenylate-forming enzyme family protein [Gordonia sp. (in: high G+C Gram-positive bacteria)]